MKAKVLFLAVAVIVVAGCAGGGLVGLGLKLAKDKIISLLLASVEESLRLNEAGIRLKTTPRIAPGQTQDFFFEPTLNLWVQILDPDHYLFFEDEAKTKPAGHDSWDRSPIGPTSYTLTHDLVYLAGLKAGQSAHEVQTINNDGSGSVVGDGEDEDGHWHYTGSWTEAGVFTWTQRVDMKDGTWLEYSKTTNTDDTFSITVGSSQGVNYFWNFNSDYSGAGRIEGNGEGLPATMVWDTAGTGTISWGDGTTTNFTGWMDLNPAG